MKNLNKNEKLAIGFSLMVVAFLLFGGRFFSLYNNQTNENTVMSSEEQSLPTTGVVTEDTQVGTGDVAENGDVLTVHYVGTLVSGKVFDSSLDRGTPFSFTLGEGRVIRGWDEGMAGMQVGGKRRLVIAPDFGYGASGVGAIPPNSTLIFDVELLDLKKAN